MELRLFETDLKMLMVRHGVQEITGVIDIEGRQTAVFRYSLNETPEPAFDQIREALETIIKTTLQ